MLRSQKSIDAFHEMTTGDVKNVEYPGVHYHAANDLLEYVIFDDAQITSCYAIHLDLGRNAASYMSKLSISPVSVSTNMGSKVVKHSVLFESYMA